MGGVHFVLQIGHGKLLCMMCVPPAHVLLPPFHMKHEGLIIIIVESKPHATEPKYHITTSYRTNMCVTNTARRQSLTLVLPNNLLTPSSTVAPFKFTTTVAPLKTPSADIAVASTFAPESQPSSSSVRVKTPYKIFSASDHLPYHNNLITERYYSDHAADKTLDPNLIKFKAKGGVIFPFPVKLHEMLDKIESDGLANVVSWASHGQCFCLHKPKEFLNHVMPHYFKQTKMASFQRQLNLYGFSRLTGGLDKGGYYHELFLRGKVSLAYEIHRQRVKGTWVRLPTNPDNEPNFYALPLVTKDALPTIASMDVPTSALSPVPVLSKPIADTALSAPVKLVVDGHAVPSFEFRDCSRKIAKTKQQQEKHAKKDDVLFFEGHPFHYLDSSEFTIPHAKQTQQAPLVKLPPLAALPNLVQSYSSVVSESDSDVTRVSYLASHIPLTRTKVRCTACHSRMT